MSRATTTSNKRLVIDVEPLREDYERTLRRLGGMLSPEGSEGQRGGLEIAAHLSGWLDAHLEEVRALLEPFADTCPVTVYATGSYGRRRVCPGSDIDLLVVYDDAEVSTCDLGLWVGGFQTTLRDIGWKVGMATRTPEQCLKLAREDLSIAASMLDARLLWSGGDTELPWASGRLAQVVADQLRERDGGRGFVRQVREGCRIRHQRSGRTVYLLEPNLKTGRGGLRDLQALQWSAFVLFDASSIAELARMPGFELVDFTALRDAADFLFRVRVALHLEMGRFANDRLTFRNQEVLARRLGYEDSRDHAARDLLAVERFMQDLYRAAHTLASMSLRWQDIWLLPEVDSRPVAVADGVCVRQRRIDLVRLKDQLDRNEVLPSPVEEPRLREEEESPSGGTWPALRPGGLASVLHPTSVGLLRNNPLRIYEAALDTGLPLHPVAETHLAREAQRVNVQNAQGPRMALSLRRLLCSLDCPEELIQSMADLRLLAAVLPEFQAVTALAQHDVYHVYTVDAHLLRAMHEVKKVLTGEASGLPEHAGPFVEVAATIPSHRHEVLVLACLLHDIGKGRGKGHSAIGARLVRDIGARLMLTSHQIEHLVLLVREHLLLPLVSQRRDLDDEETIRHVALTVRNKPILDDLVVLSAVDMMAVGPNNLTAWKAHLLMDLYKRVCHVLENGLDAVWRTNRALDKARGDVEGLLEERGGEALDAFFSSMPKRYLLSTPPRVLKRHLEAYTEAQGGVSIHFAGASGDYTELTVCTSRRSGTLATVAGVVSAHRCNILSAQINTSREGVTLDVFALQSAAGGAIPPSAMSRVEVDLERALRGDLDVSTLLDQRRSGLRGREVPPVATVVTVDQGSSSRYTILEVKTRDRVGLLWVIARCLLDAQCEIHVSKIATEGIQVIDVFYVTHRGDARKLTDAEASKARELLLGALADFERQAREQACTSTTP